MSMTNCFRSVTNAPYCDTIPARHTQATSWDEYRDAVPTPSLLECDPSNQNRSLKGNSLPREFGATEILMARRNASGM